MSIKSDRWIIQQARDHGMIEPFVDTQIKSRIVPATKGNGFDKFHPSYYDTESVEEKVISFGVSSYGYDIRAADDWKVFCNINSTIVDPKNFDESSFISVSGNDHVIIPPNSFALARSIEYFRIPNNVLAICLGKSTYARCGIVCNITPLESGWHGHLVLEFSNTTPLPAKVYANEGVAQLLFFQSDEQCITTYADRNGKYQGQTGVTLAKV